MLQGPINANADPEMLRFTYGGVLLMTAFLKIYPIPKITQYQLAYSIAINRIATPVSYHQILANTHP